MSTGWMMAANGKEIWSPLCWDYLGRPMRLQIAELLAFYLCDRISPGEGFLSALLENNLKKAYFLAPDDERMYLHVYASYLTAWAPEESWGSPAKVKDWLAQRSFRESLTQVADPQVTDPRGFSTRVADLQVADSQEECDCWEAVNDREGMRPCRHERLPAGGGPFNNSAVPGPCRCGASGPPWNHAEDCSYD